MAQQGRIREYKECGKNANGMKNTAWERVETSVISLLTIITVSTSPDVNFRLVIRLRRQRWIMQ